MTAPPAGTQGSLLLVDDEPTVLKVLTRIFDRRPYHVDAAGDAASALALLRGNAYDVVICDKNMPGTRGGDEGGLEVLAWARANRPLTEVILITGFPNVESAIRALKLGACDYIVKPFQIDVIAAKVDEIMKRRSLLDRERIAPAFHALRAALVETAGDEIPRPEERMARFEALNASLASILDGLVYRDRRLVREWETVARLAACAEELCERLAPEDPGRPLAEKMRELVRQIQS